MRQESNDKLLTNKDNKNNHVILSYHVIEQTQIQRITTATVAEASQGMWWLMDWWIDGFQCKGYALNMTEIHAIPTKSGDCWWEH